MTPQEAIQLLTAQQSMPMGGAGPHDPRWFGNQQPYSELFDAADKTIDYERKTGKPGIIDSAPYYAPPGEGGGLPGNQMAGSQPLAPTWRDLTTFRNLVPPQRPPLPVNPNDKAAGGLFGMPHEHLMQMAGDVLPLPINPGPMAGPPWKTGTTRPDEALALGPNHPANMGVYFTPQSLTNALLRRLHAR